jgi:hypothetical protein
MENDEELVPICNIIGKDGKPIVVLGIDENGEPIAEE